MFKAIGYVIVLYALAQFMPEAFKAGELAAVALFGAVETASVSVTDHIQQ